MTYPRSIGRLAASGLIVALTSLPAPALEAEAVAERLKTSFAQQGADLAWSSATLDGTTVTLEGVTVSAAGEPPASIGTIVLADISEEDGGYTIGTTTIPSMSVTEEGVTVDMTGLSISGLDLPEQSPADLQAEITLYDSAAIEQMRVSADGKEFFTLANFAIEIDAPEGTDGTVAFTGSAEQLTADLSAVEDPQAKAVIEAMGYTSLQGSMEMTGDWDPADGHASLEQFDLAIENAGTLGLAFELGGYTPAFIKSLREMQEQMESQPEGADNSAQGLAMLGLMQQLTFISAEISFEDDSLTSRVLKYMAEQQNAQPADIVNQAKAVLPFALAQLNNPEFSAAVTEAVGKFLDDPQSISISAAPAEPVPFAMLAAGAMTAPQTLPQQLGVTVTANEAE